MKKLVVFAAIAAFTVSCGGGNVQKVQSPDVAAYKAVELSSKSNSARVLKLEKELDTMKTEVDSLRAQNRQLADSYDSLVELFKEQRNLMMVIVNKVNTVVGADESAK